MRRVERFAAEEVMKAVFALVVIYIGTFLVAIQGAPQNSVQAAQNQGTPQRAESSKPIDPAKEADIRALMELVGGHELVPGSVPPSTEQDREKHSVTAPSEEQLVGIYDKHYTDDEIRGLLQFFGSPLGQKMAAEMPKINYEIQDAARMTNAQTARLAR
jgi:hypothetical protein